MSEDIAVVPAGGTLTCSPRRVVGGVGVVENFGLESEKRPGLWEPGGRPKSETNYSEGV